MKITVKSTKVLSKGTNKFGDWILVKVTTDDEEYTTLADGAEMLTPGTIINITDMDEDAKGKKFKKYEILEKGEASSSPAPNGEMTNEMWDAKAKLERDSIESQTRAERITELWIAGKINEDNELVGKLKVWLVKLGSQEKAEPKAESKTVEELFEEEKDWPPLKDLGQLYTRAQAYGLCPRDVFESVGVGKGEEIIDLDEAWTATAKRFASAIKAVSESTDK